jgi:hypothetical protein
MGNRTPGEVKTTDSKDYYIRASWEARAETPDELAARFLRMIDALKQIDPVFSRWSCGRTRHLVEFENVRDRYAEEIAAGLARSDWGEPTPVYGYSFGAVTRDTPRDRFFAATCNAGGTARSPFSNAVTFTTSSNKAMLDPNVVGYRVFRPALLAIVDAWEPAHAAAYSQQLIQRYGGDSYFSPAWIQYLCPWLAEKITPPSTVLSEYLPGGGLLMTATTETFDVDNPAHLKAAQDMAAAMAPLDALPWPSGRPSSVSG